MSQNFLITGMPKSGKTSLIQEIIDALKKRGFKIGGFISPEEKHHGTRTAFHVVNVDTGEMALLASVDGDGPKVSKYHVDIRSFESVAVPCMQQCGKYDVFVIDEIGRMEMKSTRFSSLLDDLLDSETPFIATVGNDYVERYGTHGEVFTLEEGNRERVFARVLRQIEAGALARKKKAPKKRVKKKVPKKKAKKQKARPKKKVRARKKKKARPKKKPPKKKPLRPKKKQKKKRKGIFNKVKRIFGA
jgi:nucleoside-triphosphatase